MLINISQLNQAQLALAIQQASSGAAFSGNMVNYAINSGFMGPTVLWVTGGAQDITGQKRFLDSPAVPYYSSTGTAPSARWVGDQIGLASGALNTSISQTNANLATTGTTLLTLMVNMSGALTGQGGGGGGTGSNVLVTGSAPISTPNFTGVDAITVTYDGTYVKVSGSSLGGGGGAPNSVTTTGAYIMAGTYTFSGSPLVPDPTQPSGAANLLWTSGVSGVLVARDLDVSGVLYARMTGISGAINAGASITNNYFITGTGVVAASSTGTVTNTFNITSGNTTVNSSGTVNNTFNGAITNVNVALVTGNFVNMSFWFDEYSLGTGLNMVEATVGRSFFFTGYGLGAINSGTQGWFSGSFYQRTPTNVKTNFVDFYLNSGTFFSGRGGFSQEISGLNRVGLDIYRIGTGITGLSIGLFGVGY